MRLINAQLESSIALLKYEIDHYKPTHILIVTDQWWFDLFKDLFKNVKQVDRGYVIGEGVYGNVPCVLTVRPEGKNEETMRDDILAAFKRVNVAK